MDKLQAKSEKQYYIPKRKKRVFVQLKTRLKDFE